MIKTNVGGGSNKKKWSRKLGKELTGILKVDPSGPISKILCRTGDNSLVHPQQFAEEMKLKASNGNGRYYEKDKSWWFPKTRKVEWYDNVLYITMEEDILLSWVRHRRCDTYHLFVLLKDESLEPFFAKLYGWQYVPTSSVWQGLNSSEVISHIEW